MRMIKLTLSFICLIALAVSTSANAETGRIQIQKVVTDSGIEAWLVEQHAVPVVSMAFSFGGGSSFDPEGKEGLAYLLSGLLDEGAEDLDSAAFQRALQENSISLNYSADRDRFSGSLNTLSFNTDLAFDLLAKSMNAPRFDDEPVARVKNQIAVMQKRSAQNPRALSEKRFFENAFEGHAYAKTPLGDAAVMSLSKKDLKAFKAKHLTKASLKVAVVGDIDVETLKAKLDQVFANLPDGNTAELADVSITDEGSLEVVSFDSPQSTVIFAGPGIAIKDEDYMIATVLNYTLGGGGFSSRMMDEIREKRGLTYGIYTYWRNLDATAMFYGSFSSDNGKVAEAVSIMKAELNRMRADGMTADELSDAKTYLTGSFMLRFDSNGKIARQLLAYQELDFGINYINERNAKIDAVTLEDVNRVAKRLPSSDQLTIMVVGKPQGLESE